MSFFAALEPLAWFAVQMRHGDNGRAIIFHAVNQPIGKTVQAAPPRAQFLPRMRKACDALSGSFRLIEKTIAKPGFCPS
ncbi:MAG: hypothetical protein ACLP7P_19850 [Rhodomicrobium sp.]